ncbi:glycoside hydrolase family 5 protein [Qipengyuania atrilutea]|uniref:glycoside hydrolase family 5 protein n=1 Tax=Qipengyuania atrilutea TaxID=2744473 RepID=UPI001C3D39D3|nr:glycoside hydrolase family 5 protein [Actirhodobacter atriluteus]
MTRHLFGLSTAAAALALAAGPLAAQSAEPSGLPVGTCINIGNHLEPESESAWGGKRIEASDFRNIADAGFQTIRLPVRWSNKTGSGPDFTVDAAWMDRVEEVVDQALAADLNVILDSHNFVEVHSAPEENTAKLAAIWAQIAERFSDKPNERLWFEIENEPHDQLDNENLMAVLGPALAEIRVVSPERPVIIGGEFWSGIDSLATLELPDDPNIYPTFHYYEPFDFTHQGATWADDVPPIGRKYGTAADAARLTADVAKLEAYVERTGKLPFIGETGAYDAHIPLEQRVQYHRAVTEAFAPTGVGQCAWAYTNTFPFWNQKTGEWLPGMREAFGLGGSAATSAPAVTSASAVPNVNPDLPAALQEVDRMLPGMLLNDPSSLEWQTYGSNLKVKGYADPAIPGGGAALTFTNRKAGNAYDGGANIPLMSEIEEGDTVTLGFYARTVASEAADGKGEVQVRFQRNSDPYPGFGDSVVRPGTEWSWHEVSAVADQDIRRGMAFASMQFGSQKQTVEIGQTIIVKGAPSIAN